MHVPSTPDFRAWREIRKLARKPPLGWNSWDVYGVDVTEEEVLAQAEVLADRFLSHGYDTLVIDLGWYAPDSTADNKQYQRANPHQIIDEWGRFVPCPKRFPSSAGGEGFRPLAQKLHALGLKLGIHVLRGIPIQAVWANTPVKGAGGVRARDIAVPEIRCVFYDGLYGLDLSRLGALDYYRSIFELYAAWEIDFIKADDMTSYPQHYDEVKAFRWALDHCGRPMVLSLSPGAISYHDRSHAAHHGDMYRISGDFWDEWTALKRMFEKCRLFQGHTGPGSWADCDMIPLGRINVRAESPGGARQSRFTPDEARTLITLWSIFRSPLMLGMDLTDLDSETLSLLTNRRMLELNQSSTGNHEIHYSETHSLWRAESPHRAEIYAALFNLAETAQAFSLDPAQLGSPPGEVSNLWNGAPIQSLEFEIPAHGCVALVWKAGST